MTVEAAIETALKTAITTAATAASVTVRFRCWWLDDETGSTRETATEPLVAIVARPWVPGEVRSVGTSQVGISIVTAYQEDGKRSDLADLYAVVRAAIDADEWEPESPVESMEVIVTDGDTFADREERRNVAVINLDAEVCVRETEDEDE
jgi:hypothetical protein